jgi:hypothetical protein
MTEFAQCNPNVDKLNIKKGQSGAIRTWYIYWKGHDWIAEYKPASQT